MSYVIEVYRGNQKAERHLGIYALYVMYFPQLVAGPIERPQNMLHQYHEKKSFDYDNVVIGLQQMMWGFMKKTVIGDRIALTIDPIFDNSSSASGSAIAVAVALFPIQLYCDFSGYSDIAIGASRVMGIKLMTNFNRPFVSKTITEYWRRWHISLSTWLNDYVFKPITIQLRYWQGGVVFGILVTFFVSGLWHGASWKFLMLGFTLGAAIGLEYIFRKQRKKLMGHLPTWLNNTLSIFLTYSYYCIACVFFRARSTRDSFHIIGKLGSIPGEIKEVFIQKKLAFLHLPGLIFIFYAVLLAVFMLKAEQLGDKYNIVKYFNSRPIYIRWATYYAFAFVFLYFGVFEEKQFLYFQF